MNEPAKDEAELMERVAKALHHEVYGGQSAWMDVSKFERSYREMEANTALAAIRAAGWAVVPQEPTFAMRSEGSVAMVKLEYLPSPGEVESIYRAMLAAAPGVKP